MLDLEHELSELATTVEWPTTPDLRAAIRLQITSPHTGSVALSAGSAGRPFTWYQNRWAVAAAAIIVAAAALLAYTPSREAIASWVNLHVLIRMQPVLPTPSPLRPGPLGQRLGLGAKTTLAHAQAQVDWKVVMPPSLGRPDEVYFQQPPDGPSRGEVTLVYSARPGIPVSGQTGVSVLITEARGAVDKNFFGKMIGQGGTLEDVTVAGHQGYWIAGQPHVFFFIAADGSFRDETMRLATNTLILDDSGTIVRIEGDLTKDQVLQLASELG